MASVGMVVVVVVELDWTHITTADCMVRCRRRRCGIMVMAVMNDQSGQAKIRQV